MGIITTYLLIFLISILLIPFFKVREKGIITILAVLLSAGISGYIAVKALLGDALEITFSGTVITGEIPIRIDALSAWFILIINFTIITGALYGFHYMKSYKEQSTNITLHCIAYLGIQSMLTLICTIQNSIVFLFAWEIMALSSFVLIIFEHYKQDCIKAGINYLIQAHIAIVFLYIGFIWTGSRTNSFDFHSIAEFSSAAPLHTSLVLFFCFFIAFAIKAGFVPFHTWLPYAHPAAPSHISGVMSGVIIKIGIYGILRMILLIKTDYILAGFIILFISVISGIYGVMLAILQHNLKKLLAYHSIENIGIIGIGIGLGTIGIGTNSFLLTTLGFGGGMLHVLNHSLFKSLLFYGAGNVYQATHTMNIEHLGGLVKRMPHSSFLFLLASLAICGLPPFNGFVSEFLIYSGLFKGMTNESGFSSFTLMLAVFGLVLVGGLALLCFTKAFSSVFLGTSRHEPSHPYSEATIGKLIPMYMVLVLIVAIGLFPTFFLQLLSEPLNLFTDKLPISIVNLQGIENLQSLTYTMEYIGWCAIGFILLSVLIFFIRRKITSQKPLSISPTWSCAYVGDTSKMQYTASSFVRTYRKIAEPFFSIHKKKKEIKSIFPEKAWHETHPNDKAEELFIDIPLKYMKYFFGKFRFLQNGNPQFYIMYGVVFIVLVLGLPYLLTGIKSIIEFLNNL